MKQVLFFLIVCLALNVPTVTGQQDDRERSSQPGSQAPAKGLPDTDTRTNHYKSLRETADEEVFRKSRPPLIAPKGWLDDYDYESRLDTYLNEKYQEALVSGKSTYIYLYADWYETCKIFRKKAEHKDYEKLFSSNAIVMLDYNYFRKRFKTQARRLPMILKVNENGVLGPEFIYPVMGVNEHPRKPYYKLKKFFESNETPTPA